MDYKQHPLSAAFPQMNEEEFQQLKDSIESIGVQNPITIYQGMVIDGWHRYQASQDVGVPCPSVELESDIDARDFVLAQNKTRRHITKAQLALATTEVYGWIEVGFNQHSSEQGGCAGTAHPPQEEKTSKEMADLAGVSKRTIDQAKLVNKNAEPEVVEAVKKGEIGLEKASKIAKLPKEDQAKAIHEPIPEPEEEEEYSELDAAMDQISELQNALVVAQMGDVPEEEKTQAKDKIDELMKEIKTLTAALDAVTKSRDSYMIENAQLKKQLDMQRKQLKKLNG